MSWVDYEIQLPERELNIEPLVKSNLGFDVTASDMHDRFIDDLPHSDIIADHQTFISEVTTAIETTKMNIREILPLDEMLHEFNGENNANGIKIDLPIVNPSDIVVKTMMDDNFQIVRLMVPERFGGLLRTFRLPKDKEISSISWEEEVLFFSLNGLDVNSTKITRNR